MTPGALPPVAAPLGLSDFWWATVGLVKPATARSSLRSAFAQELGIPPEQIWLVSSGRAALTLILRALSRASPRRQVVVPAYTCYSVPAAVTRAGLEIVLCDVDPHTLDFDYHHLAAILERSEPLCVISVHLLGLEADVARTRALAHKNGAAVVDDASQAFGAVGTGGRLGTLGDVGFYSFGRGKSVTSVHGGAIVTASPDLARALSVECTSVARPTVTSGVVTLAEAIAMQIFVRPNLYWLPASLRFLRLGETKYSSEFDIKLMSGVQAGLLHRWRRRLHSSGLQRVHHATYYSQMLPGFGRSASTCIRFPVVCRSRVERDHIVSNYKGRLGFSALYPGTIAQISELRTAFKGQEFPGAQLLVDRLLTIPVHPFVTDNDTAAIAALVRPVLPVSRPC